MTKKTAAAPSRDQQLDEGYRLDGQKALDTGRMEHVPFAQLAVSPFNVRKDAEVGPDDELVHSIRAHGLLQPLVGYIAKSGTAIVLICAGQRRLLALEHIAAPDTKIPVRIVDEETAIEVSLAENLERKDMNPADEVLAFKALIDTGHYDAARISSRFGFTLQHIRRRLKMAQLLPEILEALHDGKISLDAATAYASGSEEVQRDIFKKHNAKGAWKPHEPGSIRSDIALHGIPANSRIAKFIGGLEGYKAAGGTTIDEDFSELFVAEGQVDARLRDVSVVRQLVTLKQAELAEEAHQLAKKTYPFITGVEWMDMLANTWGSGMPKLQKGSELVAVEPNYNTDAKLIAERAWAAAEDRKGTVYALADVDHEGQLTIVEGKFLVGKDAWAQVQPPKEPEEERQAETPAQRDARQRESEIEAIQVNFYARSLIGETPGFGCSQVSVGHDDRLKITLIRLEPGGDDLEGENHWQKRIKPELLQPFRADAKTKYAEILAEREQLKNAVTAEREAFDAKLAELEKLAIANWPAVVVIGIDNFDEQLIIKRIETDHDDGGGAEHLLELVDSMGDPWTSDDVAASIEVIRDQADELKAEIVIYDTLEAYEQTLGETPEPAEEPLEEPVA